MQERCESVVQLLRARILPTLLSRLDSLHGTEKNVGQERVEPDCDARRARGMHSEVREGIKEFRLCCRRCRSAGPLLHDGH